MNEGLVGEYHSGVTNKRNFIVTEIHNLDHTIYPVLPVKKILVFTSILLIVSVLIYSQKR